MNKDHSEAIKEDFYAHVHNAIGQKIQEMIDRGEKATYPIEIIPAVLTRLLYDCFVIEYKPSEETFLKNQEQLLLFFTDLYHQAARNFAKNYMTGSYQSGGCKESHDTSPNL